MIATTPLRDILKLWNRKILKQFWKAVPEAQFENALQHLQDQFKENRRDAMSMEAMDETVKRIWNALSDELQNDYTRLYRAQEVRVAALNQLAFLAGVVIGSGVTEKRTTKSHGSHVVDFRTTRSTVLAKQAFTQPLPHGFVAHVMEGVTERAHRAQ